MTTINIAKIETVSLEETMTITIDLEGELYNFEAIVFDSENVKYLKDLMYLDKYSKALSITQKKAIREWLTTYFKFERQ